MRERTRREGQAGMEEGMGRRRVCGHVWREEKEGKRKGVRHRTPGRESLCQLLTS